MPIVQSILNKVCMSGVPHLLPESPNIPAWPTFDAYDPSLNEIYRYRKQVGVNLGSLFALEAWLCPDTLKKAVKKDWSSELDFLTACHDHQQARDLLEHHWATFITAQDIQRLATWGINTVRIPIGYWIVDPRKMVVDYPHDKLLAYADVYDAALATLMQLVRACEQNGLGVLIDIHGAPGGQNNDAHCGQLTPCSNCNFFTGLHASSNQSCLLTIIQHLTELLSPINNVVGIELLNEPVDHASLPKFYERACRTVVASSSHRPLPVYVGDCWQPAKYMDVIAHQLSPHHPFVVLDTHQYFCHTPADHRLSAQQNTAKVEDKVGGFMERQGPTIRRNIVVGEWSMVLNGASMKGMDERQAMMDFGAAEARVWDKTCAGQFYWTYKTADDKWYWSFVYCHEQNLLPWLKKHSGSNKSGEGLDGWVKENTAAHLDYWKTQLGDKDPKAYEDIAQHVWMYEKGFRAGFNTGLRFAQHASTQVGFKGQLAKDCRMEEKWDGSKSGGDIASHGWQYEQAFVQAIDLLDQH